MLSAVEKLPSTMDLGHTDRVSAPTRAGLQPHLLPFIARCASHGMHSSHSAAVSQYS